MLGVRARHRSQFDTRAAAAAALCGEEWERVGGLTWNKNHISTQLGTELFVRRFSVSLMSSLCLFPGPLCDVYECILTADMRALQIRSLSLCVYIHTLEQMVVFIGQR